jgi:hypothetical protein
VIRHTFRLIYGSRPVAFQLSGTPEAAVQTLAPLVRSPWSLRTGDGLVGEVSLQKVRLQYRRFFRHNDFRAHFMGRFEIDGRGTRLIGEYRRGAGVRFFLGFWFGFCILWLLLAIVIAATTVWSDLSVLMFPAAGALMLLFGAGLVHMGAALSLKDEDRLAELLREILGATPIREN